LKPPPRPPRVYLGKNGLQNGSRPTDSRCLEALGGATPRIPQLNCKERIMRGAFLAMAGFGLLLLPDSAETNTDKIIAKYIKTIGATENIHALKTLRRTGKLTVGGKFEVVILHENKRPNMVRQELALQGLTGVNAYDGQRGWKIEPWQGKKDSESLGEEELKAILEDADFDGPLVNYEHKGNKVEFVGLEPVEGTDCVKLKVTVKSGDVRTYFLDTDY
jgi:hypothetical protein